MQQRIAQLAGRVLDGHLLGRDEAAYLTTVGGDDVYDLFYWANRIRIQLRRARREVLRHRGGQGRRVQRGLQVLRPVRTLRTAVKGQSKLTDEQVLDSAGTPPKWGPTASASSTAAAARPGASWKTGSSRS